MNLYGKPGSQGVQIYHEKLMSNIVLGDYPNQSDGCNVEMKDGGNTEHQMIQIFKNLLVTIQMKVRRTEDPTTVKDKASNACPIPKSDQANENPLFSSFHAREGSDPIHLMHLSWHVIIKKLWFNTHIERNGSTAKDPSDHQGIPVKRKSPHPIELRKVYLFFHWWLKGKRFPSSTCINLGLRT